MELEMEDKKKVPRLKVTPEMAEEQVRVQLQNLQQIQEIKLDLFYPRDICFAFQQVSLFLKEQKELKKIEIQVESQRNLSFGQTLFFLKDIKKITNLSIDLSQQPHFDSQEQVTIGQCFSHYTNLQHLSISINSKFLDNKEYLFRLYDVYQNNPGIAKLDINIYEISEKYPLLSLLLSGINLLTKLEHFQLYLFQSKIQMHAITKCLEEELKEKTLLKELKLKFCSECSVQSSDFVSFNKMLENLIGLQSLQLEIPKENKSLNWKKTGIEYSLKSLTNLKSLKLQLNSNQSFECLIETIAAMKQLEKVDLNLKFKGTNKKNQKLEKFGDFLTQIQSLNSLKVCFEHRGQFELSQILNFISRFHQIKSLKELRIDPFYKIDSREEQIFDMDKLNKTISNLRVFEFIMHTVKQFSHLEESLMKAIIEAEDLEEIRLNIDNKKFQNTTTLTDELFQKIINNKNKLKLIDIYHSTYYWNSVQSEDNQSYELINKLSQNPSLEKINLFFYDGIIRNSFSLLNELSQSISSLANLSDLIIQFKIKTYLNDSGLYRFTETLKKMHVLNKFEFNFDTQGLEMKSINNFISTLKSLKKLQILILSMSGEQIYDDGQQIEFAKHFLFPEKLHTLVLSIQLKDLKFKKIEEIYKNISKLNRLNHLHINLNTPDLNYFDCVNLKNYLSYLQQLKTFETPFYAFSQLHLIALFKDIESLKNISQPNYLDAQLEICYQNPLDGTNINEQGQNDVQSEITSLSVSNNSLFTEKQFAQLDSKDLNNTLDSIMQIKKLKLKFHVSKMKRREMCSPLFFQNMGSLINLKYLSISISFKVNLGNECLNFLGSSLKTLPRLTKLLLSINMNDNPIKLELCSDFISSFGYLRSLIQFELSLNFNSNVKQSTLQIKQQTVQSLFENIKEMKKLKKLKIALKNVELDELCYTKLNQMFFGLKENLKELEFLVKIESIESSKLLENCLLQLINLQSLKVSEYAFNVSKWLKLSRLVDLKEKIGQDFYNILGDW